MFTSCVSVPVWQMHILKVTGFNGLRGSLASHPGQVGLDFMKLFATFTVIAEVGRWAVLVKMNKTGKFLLNYFTVKISVKEFRKKYLVCM